MQCMDETNSSESAEDSANANNGTTRVFEDSEPAAIGELAWFRQTPSQDHGARRSEGGHGMRMEVAGAVAALLAVAFAGVLAIFWLMQWRKQAKDLPPDDAMRIYRALLESGDITNEEFERIRRDLSAKPDSSPPRD